VNLKNLDPKRKISKVAPELGRTFNIYDLLANLMGVLVVVMKILFDQIRRSIYGNH
jgi:hypothetical protein